MPNACFLKLYKDPTLEIPLLLSCPKEKPILAEKLPTISAFQMISISVTCTQLSFPSKESGTSKTWELQMELGSDYLSRA